MMSKFDEFLSKNNVDSTSCMQKAVCHYIRNSSSNANQGAANQIEEMVLALTEWVFHEILFMKKKNYNYFSTETRSLITWSMAQQLRKHSLTVVMVMDAIVTPSIPIVR